jgi:hypothetical protein
VNGSRSISAAAGDRPFTGPRVTISHGNWLLHQADIGHAAAGIATSATEFNSI